MRRRVGGWDKKRDECRGIEVLCKLLLSFHQHDVMRWGAMCPAVLHCTLLHSAEPSCTELCRVVDHSRYANIVAVDMVELTFTLTPTLTLQLSLVSSLVWCGGGAVVDSGIGVGTGVGTGGDLVYLIMIKE